MAERPGLRSERIERRVSEGAPAWVSRALDPVVGILLLAGLFDGMAGNPIHALVLAGAGLGLVAVPPSVPDARGPLAATGEPVGRSGRRWWWVALPVAAAYGVVAGGLDRYTWPVTFAILVPGVAVLVIGSRSRRKATAEPGGTGGSAPWVIALVALGVFDVVVGHPEQAVALGVWLLAGWWLVER
jgi:hypothetical protein